MSARTASSFSADPAPGRPAWPRPVRPRLPGRLAYRLQRVLAPGPAYRWLAGTLPVTGYACPETCPKKLRNGPCGGVGADGSCEVFPDTRCVWVAAHERAQREGRVADLVLFQRPVDHRRAGRSAWVSYWAGDDADLWVPAAGTGAACGRDAARPSGAGRDGRA